MQPPERFPPDDTREWLNRATSNLAKAKVHAAGIYLEDLCIDAHEACAWALKALMIERGIDFKDIHDLTRLLTMLEGYAEPIPAAIHQAGRLSPYAMLTRYPGFEEPVSEAEYQEAVAIAETLVLWAEDRVYRRIS